MSEIMVVCQGLVKIYKVADLETVALQGLDLEVKKGEMLAIVGNSGSGKTTLLNILGGLDRPSAGLVYVNGKNLLELSDSDLARYRRDTIGFVWQQSARNLIPYLTAQENLQVPMLLAGRVGQTVRSRAEKLLQAVGLWERRHHVPAELSGGEQQRVAIAVALANLPLLLLADEPTGEVDTATAAIIYEVFRSIRGDFGTTIIVVTHDRAIASYVDRLVAVRDGKVSTEAGRRQGSLSESGTSKEALEELVVVDSAGRLQIPQELVERHGLRGRVRVVERDGQVVIQPVRQEATDGPKDRN